jgi:hypothetical protein
LSADAGNEEDVDGVFVLVDEAVPFVESSGGAALEHVQSVGPVVATGCHHMFEHAGSDTEALDCRVKVEVFDPLGVGFGPDRDQTDRFGIDLDHLRMGWTESVEESLPYAYRVPASEPAQVNTHDGGS